MVAYGKLAVLFVVLVVGGTGVAFADGNPTNESEVAEKWVYSPEQELALNHHSPDATYFRGESYVAVPINSQHGNVCKLLVLDSQGSPRWQDSLPPQRCNVHSFSDPLVADYDTDGFPEVLAPTSNETLNIYNLTTGRIESRKPLTTYGFSQPMVGNVTAAPGPETAVIDLLGGTFVFEPPNETAWTRNFSDARVRSPEIRDFDADGIPEIPVGQIEGETIVLNHDGSMAWNRSLDGVITSKWMTVGQADTDPANELVRGSYRGFVFSLDGRNGSTEWRRSFSRGATVHALGDGDGDGQSEVYVATRNGTIYSLDASSGSTEWTLQLTGDDVEFAPPPTMGDLDDDGDAELVAPSYSGQVHVVDPKSGEIVATYRRNGTIKTFPTVTDFDGDDSDEVLQMYSDGSVAALEYLNESTRSG